jgi:hypothetical protein
VSLCFGFVMEDLVRDVHGNSLCDALVRRGEC